MFLNLQKQLMLALLLCIVYLYKVLAWANGRERHYEKIV